MKPEDIPPVGIKVTLEVDTHVPEIGIVDRRGTIVDETQYGYVHIRLWHHRYKDTISLNDIISVKVGW